MGGGSLRSQLTDFEQDNGKVKSAERASGTEQMKSVGSGISLFES